MSEDKRKLSLFWKLFWKLLGSIAIGAIAYFIFAYCSRYSFSIIDQAFVSKLALIFAIFFAVMFFIFGGTLKDWLEEISFWS